MVSGVERHHSFLNSTATKLDGWATIVVGS
jgi:hypothetical protein